MSRGDLIELSSSLAHRGGGIRGQLELRLQRMITWAAWMSSRPRRPGGPPPAPVPPFGLGGMTASFDELERITCDPMLVSRVERAPTTALELPDLPPPDVAAIAESLGLRRRARPARLYDVVPFGVELDLLELRLAELHDVVDHFVVAEADRGFGGVRKPLYLSRNWERFAPFHGQVTPLVVEAEELERLYPGAHRSRTDWRGEDLLRTRLWESVRPLVQNADAIVIWADVDELLPRWLLRLLKDYECPLPMRIMAPALRYHFGWSDPEATAGITVFDARSFAQIDESPRLIRSLPARTFSARGAVHLTSFLDPAALLMKCALTTDWDASIVPYLRNQRGEVAAMMRAGTWFGRSMAPYDAERDPQGLIPGAARRNRERYSAFWPVLE